MAEANDSPIQYDLLPMLLNGNGSSVNSLYDDLNRFEYLWYSHPGSKATVTNVSSLNSAVLNPTLEET